MKRLFLWSKSVRESAISVFLPILETFGFKVAWRCNDCGAEVAFTDRAREYHSSVCPVDRAA